nr:cytochrome c oxidase subunit II [Venus verrucosa]UJH93155.1 cytochrome c oxidase subunit II [Venus verrucosa]UJH93181.1 cytochrome c oxidase subunit II [Venus verrucosa]UJH93207.1 cytochrome c oxidase subunit II [Venus verrucosa]UJH93246.1 cytochrome c oxidase subunit II [Venus verrucosa]
MLFKLSFWNQFGFPDPATEMAGRLYIYHDLAMVVLVMVMLVVGWFLLIMLLGGLFFDGSMNRYVYKNELLETFWTVLPALFLIVLGYVSLKNLYDMEVGDYVGHTVKVTGHQWYWEYYYEVNFSKEICKNEHLGSVSTNLNLVDIDYLKSFLSCDWLLVESKMDSKVFEALLNDEAMKTVSTVSSELVNDEVMKMVSMVSPEESTTDNGVESLEMEELASLYSLELTKNMPLENTKFSPNSIMGLIAELFLKGDWFLKYDSYLVPESELVEGDSKEFGVFRNQAVGSSCLLAYGKKNEVLVLTADVMHSWGVPELGVKADAVPGRCNSLSIEPVLSGIMFGNCYELCGEGHSQMPINVIVMDYSDVVMKVKKEIFESEGVEDFFVSF